MTSLTNARIVLPDGIHAGGALTIENGRDRGDRRCAAPARIWKATS